MNKKVDVIWVGLSEKKAAKGKVFKPLSPDTNSGKLIQEIELKCPEILFYKTNLVKEVPLDDQGKLRYPTVKECSQFYPDLQSEIRKLSPRVVILLGQKTGSFVLDQLGFKMSKFSNEYENFKCREVTYVPVQHPSYIMVYKRKEKAKYIEDIKNIINKLA
jgi:DNA polymerase